MSILSRVFVGLSVLAVLGWAASPALSQDGTGTGAKVRAGKNPGRVAGNRAAGTAKRAANLDLTGPAALAEAALGRITTLPDDVRTKATEALKAVKDKAADDLKAAANAPADAKDPAAGADAGKGKNAANRGKRPAQADGVKNYQTAKAALKDILSPDQLASLDQQAQTIMTEAASKQVRDRIDPWVTKANVELSADQKTKIDDAVGKLKDGIAKLSIGDKKGVLQAAAATLADVRANVLTDDQRAKLPNPALAPRAGGKANKAATPPAGDPPKTDAPPPVN